MTEKRRILHKLKISEISCVDRPCQEHARMVIMKRADDIEKDAANIEGALHVPTYLRRKKKLQKKIELLKGDIINWDPSKHPRDKKGEFSSGSGSKGEVTQFSSRQRISPAGKTRSGSSQSKTNVTVDYKEGLKLPHDKAANALAEGIKQVSETRGEVPTSSRVNPLHVNGRTVGYNVVHNFKNSRQYRQMVDLDGNDLGGPLKPGTKVNMGSRIFNTLNDQPAVQSIGAIALAHPVATALAVAYGSYAARAAYPHVKRLAWKVGGKIARGIRRVGGKLKRVLTRKQRIERLNKRVAELQSLTKGQAERISSARRLYHHPNTSPNERAAAASALTRMGVGIGGNPYHDEYGRFSSGPGGSSRAERDAKDRAEGFAYSQERQRKEQEEAQQRYKEYRTHQDAQQKKVAILAGGVSATYIAVVLGLRYAFKKYAVPPILRAQFRSKLTQAMKTNTPDAIASTTEDLAARYAVKTGKSFRESHKVVQDIVNKIKEKQSSITKNFGGNPYHDALGHFASAASAMASGAAGRAKDQFSRMSTGEKIASAAVAAPVAIMIATAVHRAAKKARGSFHNARAMRAMKKGLKAILASPAKEHMAFRAKVLARQIARNDKLTSREAIGRIRLVALDMKTLAEHEANMAKAETSIQQKIATLLQVLDELDKGDITKFNQSHDNRGRFAPRGSGTPSKPKITTPESKTETKPKGGKLKRVAIGAAALAAAAWFASPHVFSIFDKINAGPALTPRQVEGVIKYAEANNPPAFKAKVDGLVKDVASKDNSSGKEAIDKVMKATEALIALRERQSKAGTEHVPLSAVGRSSAFTIPPKAEKAAPGDDKVMQGLQALLTALKTIKSENDLASYKV